MNTMRALTGQRIKDYVCKSCLRKLNPHRRRNYATASTLKSEDIYDVVCVGGGPAGLSLLSALRSSPVTRDLRIALIESQDLSTAHIFSPPKNKFSNRCSSLTPSSVRFLEDIGAWSHVQKNRVQPYQEMQVWDGITDARIEFSWPDQIQGSTIAYMNENLNLTSALLLRLEELGGVDILDNQRVEDITPGTATDNADMSGWPIVRLTNGKQLAARLLVGADGQSSPVRAFAGIESRGWDYEKHGVVATLQLESSGRDEEIKTAYQRFLPTGPVALLPLPGNFATLVWSTTSTLATHLKSLGASDFIAMVNAAFRLSPTDLAYLHLQDSGQLDEVRWRLDHTQFDRYRLPEVAIGVQEGSVASFPLKLRHADSYISERVALVGDAAHTIHPLAGQGLNQGQGDVESLAKTIEYAVSHGQDIGVKMSLESYNFDRYTTNNILLGTVDKLHKLYSFQSGPLVPLRSIGLRAVNALGPLKQFFMERAAGTGPKYF